MTFTEEKFYTEILNTESDQFKGLAEKIKYNVSLKFFVKKQTTWSAFY